MKCAVLDNGAFIAKIGHTTDQQPKIIPNCIMKVQTQLLTFLFIF